MLQEVVMGQDALMADDQMVKMAAVGQRWDKLLTRRQNS